MNDALREPLKRAGWRASDRYKGFLQTRRGGIDFHLGVPRSALPGETAALELRYRYVTPRTDTEGTVDLPIAAATPERIGDTMTTIYLRIHERPDPSRTLGGGGSRKRSGVPAPVPSPNTGAAPFSEADTGQTELDL